METVGELKEDLQELETILNTVVRSNVRRIIADEITALKSQVEALENKKKTESLEATKEKEPSKPSLYTVKLSNYGFDESSKFVKLYVSIKDVEKLTPEQVTCDFTETSFKFVVQNHLGKNHMLQIVRLAHQIKPEGSSCKIKAGNILISLKKEKEGQTWGVVTEAERKAKEAKDAKMDSSKDSDMSDPSGGIMNLMKKMYEDGDDDTKRMIKKTWYESQQKQGAGGMPGGMPSF